MARPSATNEDAAQRPEERAGAPTRRRACSHISRLRYHALSNARITRMVVSGYEGGTLGEARPDREREPSLRGPSNARPERVVQIRASDAGSRAAEFLGQQEHLRAVVFRSILKSGAQEYGSSKRHICTGSAVHAGSAS